LAFEVYKPNNISKNKTIYVLTQRLKQRLEVLKSLVLEDFKKAVWINVYVKYNPKVYERTYALINSLTVSEVKQEGNSIYFDITFDRSKLTHYSVVTGSSDVYIPPLIDESHKQQGYDKVDYFHNYPALNFMEEALIFIKSDLNKVLRDMVKYEIKKLGGKNKR
jgi:hypothetical protein